MRTQEDYRRKLKGVERHRGHLQGDAQVRCILKFGLNFNFLIPISRFPLKSDTRRISIKDRSSSEPLPRLMVFKMQVRSPSTSSSPLSKHFNVVKQLRRSPFRYEMNAQPPISRFAVLTAIIPRTPSETRTKISPPVSPVIEG